MAEAGPTERFGRVGLLAQGYAPDQVDQFLRAVDGRVERGEVSAQAIRRVGFDLVRRGYAVGEVDAHLDDLEARAVAAEARLGAARAAEEREGVGQGLRAEVADLLARPAGERLPRAGRWQRGYEPADVDALLARVEAALSGGGGLDAARVRTAVFAGRRGGYDEEPVDALLDRVVDVLLRRG